MYKRQLVDFGISEKTEPSEIKRIRLLNLFCWFWHFRTVLQLINDYFQGEDLNESLLTFFSSTSVAIIIQALNYHNKYFSARVLFIFSVLLFCFLYGVYIKPNENVELNYILVPGTTLILFDNKRVIAFFNIFSLFLIYLTIHLTFKLNKVEYDYFGVSVIYLSVFIMIGYFKKLNLKNESVLEEKTLELEELDKFKSHFFTNISHEIRTPLTIIKGQIDSLNDNNLSEEKINAIHSNTNNQIQTITSIVNTVMDLAKMKSSNFKLNTQTISILELIKKVHMNFEGIFSQKNLTLSLELPSKDYYTNIDAVFIERAFNNVLNNAYKYTEKGLVAIKVHQKDNFINIEICDSGIGISTENQKNIFKSFYQVDNDINKSGGSGIGLSFSKEIIKLHKGKITVKSKENEGSCFIISLPVINTNHEISSSTNLLENIENQLINELQNSLTTFLIVDDNKDMLEYLNDILKNYNCISATNGIEALEILQNEKIDFIITDYMMPKMNGLEFSKKLKELKIDLPVIMITAKTAMEIKLEILNLGVKDYLTKPFDKNELLARVNNLLENQMKKIEYNQTFNIETSDNNYDLLTQIEQHINSNSNFKELTLEFLSKKLNVSKSSLYRHIKSQTGLSPKEYITEIRLQKARRIIENNPNILLKQISLEVGFTHSSYFSNLYEKRFGVKPFSKD